MAEPPAPNIGAPPGPDVIAALAQQALAEIPRELQAHVHGVGIAVEELADDATLSALGLDSPWELAGLYRGAPLRTRGVNGIARTPDLISLFRGPILLEWVGADIDLYRLLRNVVIHEIAHHLGFSDAEIEALDRD